MTTIAQLKADYVAAYAQHTYRSYVTDAKRIPGAIPTMRATLIEADITARELQSLDKQSIEIAWGKYRKWLNKQEAAKPATKATRKAKTGRKIH